MNVWHIVLLALAGLVMFLYAVNRLSLALRSVVGERAKSLLQKFTQNLFMGILTGTLVTVLLDSSSAVIIIVIALVSAGVLTFRHALGVVLGANIGTTISSQLYAFDLGEYAAVAMVPGFLLLMLGKRKRTRTAGRALFSFGLLFFSLYFIGEAVAPLKGSVAFRDWLHGLEHPLKGVLVGAGVTFLIQSSSATVGMVVEFASKGLMTLPAGVAVMLGAELGTCSDTLLATVGRGRPALKTAIFHLGFNVLSITLGVHFIDALVGLVHLLAGHAHVERQIAHAHVLFNVLGVLAFAPLVPLAQRLLDSLLPDKAVEKKRKSLQAAPV